MIAEEGIPENTSFEKLIFVTRIVSLLLFDATSVSVLVLPKTIPPKSAMDLLYVRILGIPDPLAVRVSRTSGPL